ncbi:MAG: GNAT family N-acetyltransferase [Clostridia bacterium]|nr:GNAT family N-acetyltransferase [Clostridia bacterium]
MKMSFVRYSDIKMFSEQALAPLMQNEAANNLMIGIMERGLRLNCAGEWLMATIQNGEHTELIALMTPPHNLLISAGDCAPSDDALNELIKGILDNDIEIPGLLCEKMLAERFIKMYTQKAGGRFLTEMEERVYVLTETSDIQPVGTIRKVNEKDMHFLPYWLSGFMKDALGEALEVNETSAKAHVENGTLYVLEVDGMPVSIAGTARKTPNGRSIGPVYTPPYFRKKGYATSCVMHLSRKLLDEGNQFLALFTDLSNPASNTAYQKVGYRPICDCMQMKYQK